LALNVGLAVVLALLPEAGLAFTALAFPNPEGE